MRGCRHSGVRVIVPPRCAPSPTRITCRYVRPQRTPHPPPLMEGEALASRVLELGPVGAKFLGPVIIEVPHFAALRGKEREIVILRSDNGESWKEHTVEATDEILNEVLHDSFDAEDLNQMEDMSSGRITRILTQDFPQYFAVVSRIRQEVHVIGPEGGMVSSTVVPQVQAVFPEGALTKKIKVGLQAQPIDPELTAKLLGHGVAVSPVVTVEPRRRKFHKAITLSMPAPRAHSQGMINQYSGSAPTLRLLCSITGGTTRAQWEDVTGSTPLTFVNDCVSFTTTVSARFWLMDCRNIGDATKMATELYKEAIHVPFMAKFVVFAKRVDPLEARLRVFCMTDDKEDKTLEQQEHFIEVAKSRDVEVLEGKPQYVEFAGNLVPITKSGEQLSFSFRAFRENRLPFSVRVKDQHAEAVSRCLFMKEPKVPKGEPPQQPICILNIVLPDDIVIDTISLTDGDSLRKHAFLSENFDYYRPDPRLADMSNLLGDDWVPLAVQLGLTTSEINVIKSEYPDSVAKQAQSMLRMWLSQSGNKAQTNTLENALRRIGREDIIPQCLNVDHTSQTITRIKQEEIENYRLKKDVGNLYKDVDVRDGVSEVLKKRPDIYDKYSAEEKAVEKSDEEEEDAFDKPVAERREKIEKRLSAERTIPASSQRREIVQEITDIKRQSLVEDKIAEVQQKVTTVEQKLLPEQSKTTHDETKTIVTKTVAQKEKPITTETVEVKTTLLSDSKVSVDAVDTFDAKTVVSKTRTIPPNTSTQKIREDTELLEGVTQSFEKKQITPKLIAEADPKSPKFSKTPPPSPADFLLREQAATVQEWETSKKSSGPESEAALIKNDAAQKGKTTPTTIKLACNEEISLVNKPLEEHSTFLPIETVNINKPKPIYVQTSALIKSESCAEPYHPHTDKHYKVNLLKTKLALEDKSIPTPKEVPKEKKMRKQSILGSIKTFVGRSLEYSDSDSEKSPKKDKIVKKEKKKKTEIEVLQVFPEVPLRPPRKQKISTPIADRKYIDIPFVEISSLDLPATYQDSMPTLPKNNIHPVEGSFFPITDKDKSKANVSDDIKDKAREIIGDIVVDGEKAAKQLLKKKRKDNVIVIEESVTKTIAPITVEEEEFTIIVDPTKKGSPKKTRETFTLNIDKSIEEIEKEILEKSPILSDEKLVKPFAQLKETISSPIIKDSDYEDIQDSVASPTFNLPVLSSENQFPASSKEIDIKTITIDLIQNEIGFAGWANDNYSVGILKKDTKMEPREKITDSQKIKKKQHKLFGLFGRASRDENTSDEEADVSEDIKKVDKGTLKEVKNLQHKSPKLNKNGSKETQEQYFTETNKKTISSDLKKLPKGRKDMSKEKEEKRFLGLFKKGKREEGSKPAFSDTAIKDIINSTAFLKEEIEKYHDYMPIIKDLLVTSVKGIKDMNQTDLFIKEEVERYHDVRNCYKIQDKKCKTTNEDLTDSCDQFISRFEKNTTQKSKIPDKTVINAENKISESQELPSKLPVKQKEDGDKGFLNLFKKKIKDSKEKQGPAGLPLKTIKCINDTEIFLNTEIKKFHDVKSESTKTMINVTEDMITANTNKPLDQNYIKAKTDMQVKSSKIVEENISVSDSFLKHEVINYYNSSPIKIKDTIDKKEPFTQYELLKDKEKTGILSAFKKETPKDKDSCNKPKKNQVIFSKEIIKNLNDSQLFLDKEINKYYDVSPINNKDFKKNMTLQRSLGPVKSEDYKLSRENITVKNYNKEHDLPSINDQHFNVDLENSIKKKCIFMKIGKQSDTTSFPKECNKHQYDVLNSKESGKETLPALKDVTEKGDQQKSDKSSVFDIIKNRLSEEKDIERKKIENKDNLKIEKNSIKNSTYLFLQEEISKYQDVRPTIQDKELFKEKEPIKPKEEDKGAFFSIFKKKSSEGRDIKKNKLQIMEMQKETYIRDMHVTDKFIKNEVDNYHDVPPTINKNTFPKQEPILNIKKSPMPKTEDKSSFFSIFKKKPSEERDIGKNKSQTLTENPETSIINMQPTLFKEEFVLTSDLSDKKIEDQTEIFTKANTQFLKKENINKRKINADNITKECNTIMQTTDSFVQAEVNKYHDVRPVIVKESKLPFKELDKKKEDKNENKNLPNTYLFLKEEVNNYHDVYPIITKKTILQEETKLTYEEPNKLNKEKIGENMFFMFNGKTLEESHAKTEKLIAGKICRVTENNMQNTDSFLKYEIKNYYDVRPIIISILNNLTISEKLPEIKKEVRGGLFGILKKKMSKEKDAKNEIKKVLVLSDTPIKYLQDTSKFLRNEVDKYHDVTSFNASESKVEIKPKAENSTVFSLLKNKSIEDKAVKKEEKSMKLSNEVVKHISDTQAFLRNEVKEYYDERSGLSKKLPVETNKHRFSENPPILKKKEKSEEKIFSIFKKNHHKNTPDKIGPDQPIILSKDIGKEITDTNLFLKKEIKSYFDARPILTKMNEKKPKEEIKNKFLSKLKNKQIEEKEIKKEENVIEESKNYLQNIEKNKETKEKVQGGFLYIFKKKASEEKELKKEKNIILSKEVKKIMQDTVSFLDNEKDKYHDVHPIINKEIAENINLGNKEKKNSLFEILKKKPSEEYDVLTEKVIDVATTVQEFKKVTEEPEISKDTDNNDLISIFKNKTDTKRQKSKETLILSKTGIQNIKDTNAFLNEEIDKYYDVYAISVNSVEKKMIEEPTNNKSEDKKERTKLPNAKTETIKQSLKQDKLNCELQNSSVKTENKIGKNSVKEIQENPDVFHRDPERTQDLKLSSETKANQRKKHLPELSESTVMNMIISSNFICEEVSSYHDVRPIIETYKKEVEDKSEKKSKGGKLFGLFGHKKSLDKEVTEPNNKTKTKDEEKNKLISEKVDLIKADVSNEFDKKDFHKAEIDRYQEHKEILEDVKEMQKKLHEKSFFGLFCKKTKPQENLEDKSKKLTEPLELLSQEATDNIRHTNEFIKQEIGKYHDVRYVSKLKPSSSSEEIFKPIHITANINKNILYEKKKVKPESSQELVSEINDVEFTEEITYGQEPKTEKNIIFNEFIPGSIKTTITKEIIPKGERATTITTKNLCQLEDIRLDPNILKDLSSLDKDIDEKIAIIRQETKTTQSTYKEQQPELIDSNLFPLKKDMSTKIQEIHEEKNIPYKKEIFFYPISEQVGLTKKFLENELKKYEDGLAHTKAELNKKKDHKERQKKSALFGVFGKKHFHDSREPSQEKNIADIGKIKPNHSEEEHIRYVSPFRVFSKTTKYDINPESEKVKMEKQDTIKIKCEHQLSVEALKNMQDSYSFLTTELENYEDGKPELVTDIDDDSDKFKSTGLFGIFGKKEKLASPKVTKKKIKKQKSGKPEKEYERVGFIEKIGRKLTRTSSDANEFEETYTKLDESIEADQVPELNVNFFKSLDSVDTEVRVKRVAGNIDVPVKIGDNGFQNLGPKVKQLPTEIISNLEKSLKEINKNICIEKCKDGKKLQYKKSFNNKLEMLSDKNKELGQKRKTSETTVENILDKNIGKNNPCEDLNLGNKTGGLFSKIGEKLANKDARQKKGTCSMEVKEIKETGNLLKEKNIKTEKKSILSNIGEKVSSKSKDDKMSLREVQQISVDLSKANKPEATDLGLPTNEAKIVGDDFVSEVMESFDNKLENVKDDSKSLNLFLQTADTKFKKTITLSEEINKSREQDIPKTDKYLNRGHVIEDENRKTGSTISEGQLKKYILPQKGYCEIMNANEDIKDATPNKKPITMYATSKRYDEVNNKQNIPEHGNNDRKTDVRQKQATETYLKGQLGTEFSDFQQKSMDFIESENLNVESGEMTRTISDYACQIKEKAPTKKISEANIDLSNFPINMDEYGVKSHVRSPTLARRTMSQKFVKPEGLDVSKVFILSGTDLNKSDSYVVTEPKDTVITKINTSVDSTSRKPLFHIASEDDEMLSDKSEMEIAVDTVSAEQKLEGLLDDLNKNLSEFIPIGKSYFITKGKSEEHILEEHKRESQADVDLIEKKLRDLDKALDSLEQLDSQTFIVPQDIKTEKTLKRVERKFERMSSQVIKSDNHDGKNINLTSPEVDEKREKDFGRLVSQISTEDLSDFQREYSHLWDEQTFSKSEEWNSKTPDSQADAQELPQGKEETTPEALVQSQQPSTSVRAEGEESAEKDDSERKVADQHQLSEEMKELLKELEKEGNQ